jgi:hypothetical protein
VKETSLKRSSLLSVSASFTSQGTIEKAPCGKSVQLVRMSPKIAAVTGVRSEGLSTNGHPAAIAGPTLCACK